MPNKPRLRPLAEVEQEEGYEWATRRWLRRQVYEGKFPSTKIGGRVLVDLNDLDDALRRGRRTVVPA